MGRRHLCRISTRVNVFRLLYMLFQMTAGALPFGTILVIIFRSEVLLEDDEMSTVIGMFGGLLIAHTLRTGSAWIAVKSMSLIAYKVVVVLDIIMIALCVGYLFDVPESTCFPLYVTFSFVTADLIAAVAWTIVITHLLNLQNNPERQPVAEDARNYS